MSKIRRLSKICPKGDSPIDSVKQSLGLDSKRRAYDILFEAQQYYCAMDKFRRDRERNKRYAYGDQWKDIVNVDGRPMTEEQYIKDQGNVPLKNNLIGRLIQSVLGVYRQQQKEPTCVTRDRDEQRFGETMSTLLQYNMQTNNMEELNALCMEEYLISGMAVQRKWAGWKMNRYGCWSEYIPPTNFFVDTNMRHPEGDDAICVGEIHDIDFKTLCTLYAKSPQDVSKFAEIYKNARSKNYLTSVYGDFGYSLNGGWDFFIPQNKGMCRVIEVWRIESKPRYHCYDPNGGERFKINEEDLQELVLSVNEQRLQRCTKEGIPVEEIPMISYEWFVDSYWYYYILTPFGDIIQEGETPYEHEGHPYVFRMYPYIDGEIHSFVGNVIDQQRYTNRLISMYDWVMRASAKGVLLFPEDCLPDGMSPDDIADEWTRYNGVIMMKQPKAGGSIPQQISSNNTNIGIGELLNIQLKFFEDISGVNGAMQGKPGFSGMSASLYAQQANNASVSLLHLLSTFSSFIRRGAKKEVQNIQQYYEDRQIRDIVGKATIPIKCNPNNIRNVEFDLNIVESTTTPTHRIIANDMLMQLYQSQAITVEQLLEHGDFPFADNLLESIKSEKAKAQDAQAEQMAIQQQMSQQAPQQAPVENNMI